MTLATDRMPGLLRDVHAYWHARCARDALPRRGAIDPIDLPRYLPDISLVDVVDGGGVRRFRYRLVGTDVVEKLGQDPTGRHFDEVYACERLIAIAAQYDRCVERRAPVYSPEAVPIAGREFLEYQRLLLPLAEDGRRVDTLLVAFAFAR